MRADRVADQLRRILANIFISSINIPGSGLITVTKVIISDDLSIAKVYVSFLNNKKSCIHLLNELVSIKKTIRHNLGLKIELKYVPELRFYYDEAMEYAERIDKLINKIHKND